MTDRAAKFYLGYVRRTGPRSAPPSEPNTEDPQGPQPPLGVPLHNSLEGLQGGNEESNEFFHLTEAQLATIEADTSTRRIAGGVIQWAGSSYDFNISSVLYKVQGQEYTIGASAILTLDPSDATLNRTDAIYVDADRTFKVRKGIEGPAFTPPDINPATEVLLGFIQVPAASTQPGGITDLLVYDEGTETTFSTVGTGTAINNDTTAPYQGTNAVLITDPSGGFKIRFAFASDQDVSNATSLGLFLQRFSAIRNNHNITAKWLDSSNNQLGFEVNINFDKSDPSLTNTYQFATVEFLQFGLGSTQVRTLEIEIDSRNRTYPGFRIDLIKVEGGITQPPPTPTQPDPPVAKEYPDQATMLANQSEQKDGYLYFDGTDTWWFKGTFNGLISDYQPFGGIYDVLAGTNITIDKSDPKNPIINATGGGGDSYLSDLDTWPVLKFDKNYRYTHEMTGPVQISSELSSPLGAKANFNKIYIKANGSDKPTFTPEFEVVWDNWNNTTGFWNRFYAELSPEGKIILQIEQAQQGIPNAGSGGNIVTIQFDQNYVQETTITAATEIQIDSTDAEVGNETILYVKADGVNKPFWNDAEVVCTFDNYINAANTWHRFKFEWRPEAKAILQIINI